MRTNLCSAALPLLLLTLLAGCSQTTAVTAKRSAVNTEASQVATAPAASIDGDMPQQTAAAAGTAQPVANAVPLLSAAEQAQFSAANALLADGQYAQAATQLGALVNKLPDAGGIRYNLALAQWQQGKLPDAQQTLTAITPAQRHYASAVNLQGVIARQQGRFTDAEQYFKQAVTADASLALAHKNLAFLYELYLGQLLQARYHYQQYFALTQDEQAKGWLVLLEQQLAQEQADD